MNNVPRSPTPDSQFRFQPAFNISPTVSSPVTTNSIPNSFINKSVSSPLLPKRSYQHQNINHTLAVFSPTPESPSISSPIPRRTQTPSNPDCACHHILISKDSNCCALCDDEITMLTEIQEDREQQMARLEEYKESLSLEKQSSCQFQRDIITLTKKIEDMADQLSIKSQHYHALENDIIVLQKKYITEREEMEKIKQAKVDIEDELEDLSQKLFEEANSMVAIEKREKYLLEIQCNHLKEELQRCRKQKESAESHLNQLKSKMGELEEEHRRGSLASATESTLSDDNLTVTSHGDDYVEGGRGPSRDLIGLFENEDIITDNDMNPLIVKEFREFVNDHREIPIRKINTMSYIRMTIAEDIEPCLQFGPFPRMNSKKLYEAIALNTCFIEETPYNFVEEQVKRSSESPLKISPLKNMLWERLSHSNTTENFVGCQACGRTGSPNNSFLSYRFRISLLDDWACIDKYCRDRLMAVCEFYNFARNIRQGYYNGRSLNDLYQESLRLKIQMFYARMGLLPQTLIKMGVDNDSIIRASPPNMIIPPAIGMMARSLSSPTKPFMDSISSLQITSDGDGDLGIAQSSSVHPGNSVWVDHVY
ncbi:hypothetical protein BDB01DRAFT_717410 [Pilobolus umbonatus]|nr:hypothetical protein BDB01DRAFT_717410 [Pilobolus umbonatus]